MIYSRLILLVVLSISSTLIMAHHGWRWTSDTDVEVTGVIESAKLGNPHGILIIDVDGEKWTAEVGQPWRNARAGLKDEMFAKGVEIIVEGQRSSVETELRIKAESVVIGGKEYILYRNR